MEKFRIGNGLVMSVCVCVCVCVFNVPKLSFFCVLDLDRNKMLRIIAFFAHSGIFLNFPELM